MKKLSSLFMVLNMSETALDVRCGLKSARKDEQFPSMLKNHLQLANRLNL